MDMSGVARRVAKHPVLRYHVTKEAIVIAVAILGNTAAVLMRIK
jgi:hypothetical protein